MSALGTLTPARTDFDTEVAERRTDADYGGWFVSP